MTCPQNKRLQRIQLVDSKNYVSHNVSLLFGAASIKKNCTYKRMLIVQNYILKSGWEMGLLFHKF